MKIIIDLKSSNWNDITDTNRRNKYLGNQLKQKEMKNISYFLIGKPKITKYPIKLICTWHIKNINQDLDNKSLKMVLDQLQVQGILENDNLKHINEITHKYIKDTKDYLELEILES